MISQFTIALPIVRMCALMDQLKTEYRITYVWFVWAFKFKCLSTMRKMLLFMRFPTFTLTLKMFRWWQNERVEGQQKMLWEKKTVTCFLTKFLIKVKWTASQTNQTQTIRLMSYEYTSRIKCVNILHMLDNYLKYNPCITDCQQEKNKRNWK